MAKAKSSLAKRIMTDPVFERTRENMAEFQQAAKSGKLVVDAFRSLVMKAKDNLLTSRLNKKMMEVLETDPTSDRGLRVVHNGDIALLNGFDFNINAKLGSLFFAPYTASVDRTAGTLKIDIPAFVPDDYVAAPSGASHYQLLSAAAEINFAEGTYLTIISNTGELVYGKAPEAAISLTNTLTANSTNWLFQVFGVRFFTQVNGKFYSLNSGKSNALSVVSVSAPAA